MFAHDISRGGEGVHALCYAECPMMYALRVPIEMSIHRTESLDCSHSPRQPPILYSLVRLVSHQGCYLMQQGSTCQVPESSHKLAG
jgi:hypothetical protein